MGLTQSDLDSLRAIYQHDPLVLALIDALPKPRHYSRDSSTRDDWVTPPWLVERVRYVLGEIDLDPCTNPANPTKAVRWICPPDDGLNMPWSGRVFVNPPFGRVLARWAHAAIQHATTRTPVMFLAPTRSTSKWYQALSDKGARANIHKRVNYCDPQTGVEIKGCPFGSTIWLLGGADPVRFVEAFRDIAEMRLQ